MNMNVQPRSGPDAEQRSDETVYTAEALHAQKSERPLAVFGAMAANLAIAVTKFIVTLVTGSSAMLSEAIHSLVDTANECLLLVGLRRSRKPADRMHPFGHGKELYFWSLLVAIVLFGVGGGMSLYEGIVHIERPVPMKHAFWNYIVLAIAFAFESFSLTIALREFRPETKREGLWQALRSSKDPSIVTVIFEDCAAIAGLAIAFAGIFLGHMLDSPYMDGAASVAIGILLCTVSVLLAYESRGLLIGETADRRVVESIQAIAREHDGVDTVLRVLTMQLGAHEILLNLEVRFRRDLNAEQIIRAIETLEHAIKEQNRDVRQIFIEAESYGTTSDEVVSAKRLG